jgi:hypothetical protein
MTSTTSRRLAAFLGASLAFCSLVPAAVAQPAGDAAGDDVRARARELFQHGRQLFDQGRTEEALDELTRSHDLLPTWAASNGMALCEERLGHEEEALLLYETALREGGDGIPEAQRIQIENRIGLLRRELRLVRLAVTTTPPGATLALDGDEIGTTPFSGNAPEGLRTLRVSLEGYETVERPVELVQGEAQTLDVALVAVAAPPPLPPPVRSGRLAVTADAARCTVLVDGAPIGVTPVDAFELPAGEHLVRVETREASWEERIDVAGGETVRLDVRLGLHEGLHPAWFWTTAATAGAAAVGFVAAGGYAWSLHDEYVGASQARQDEIRPTAETTLDAADALLGVASAAAVGALVLFFFTDFDGEPPSAEITLEAPAQGVGDATDAAWYGTGL